jgi:hypothetical protein
VIATRLHAQVLENAGMLWYVTPRSMGVLAFYKARVGCDRYLAAGSNGTRSLKNLPSFDGVAVVSCERTFPAIPAAHLLHAGKRITRVLPMRFKWTCFCWWPHRVLQPVLPP